MGDFANPTNKFTWGDAVVVKNEAPLHLHPGRRASICSVIKPFGGNMSSDSGDTDIEWFYTIEFSDGSSIDIDESFLDKVDQSEPK